MCRVIYLYNKKTQTMNTSIPIQIKLPISPIEKIISKLYSQYLIDVTQYNQIHSAKRKSPYDKELAKRLRISIDYFQNLLFQFEREGMLNKPAEEYILSKS